MSYPVLLVHLLAVAVLIGYLLAPALPPQRATSAGGRGASSPSEPRWVAWSCLAVLLLSGVLMLSKWHVGLEEIALSAFYESRFGRLMVIKLLATTALAVGLVLARAATSWLARLNLLIALFVIVVSIHIVR